MIRTCVIGLIGLFLVSVAAGQEPHPIVERCCRVALEDALTFFQQNRTQVSARQAELAAAAIHRRLQYLTPTKRFQVLQHWSLGDGHPPRHFNLFCQVDTPPPEFARLITGAKGDVVFGQPSVAGVSGIFCTASLLVDAAVQAEQLQELANSLEGEQGNTAEYLSFLLDLANRNYVSYSDVKASSLSNFDRGVVDLVNRATEVPAQAAHSTTGRDQPTEPETIDLFDTIQGRRWTTRGVIDDSDLWSMDGPALTSAAAEPTPAWLVSERLLSHRQSLSQGGKFAYEFHYQAGKETVHPAIGRLAFLIQPAGVVLHWVTDGADEWTGLKPDNSITQPLDRQGSGALPLTENAWNQIELTRQNQQVSIFLNQTLIYQHTLADRAEAQVGFFHTPGRERVMVRNAILVRNSEDSHADRPLNHFLAKLPVDNLLANEFIIASLDRNRARMSFVFSKRFSKLQELNELFELQGQTANSIIGGDDGIQISVTSDEPWSRSVMECGLSAVGDFEIEADYADFVSVTPKNGSAMLDVGFHDPSNTRIQAKRVKHSHHGPILNAHRQFTDIDTGQILHEHHTSSCEAKSGTLRLARRGSQVHVLHKTGESDYEYLATHDVSDLPTNGIQLSVAVAGEGRTSVTWKRLEVRAEQLLRLTGDQAKRRVFCMNADGTELKQISRRLADFETARDHLFPSLSPDGKTIIFEASIKGQPQRSHICAMDVDGSHVRDLGIGCLPTFSPNGDRIAIATFSGNTLINPDGSDRQRVKWVGWSFEFSPDGTQWLNPPWRRNNQSMGNLSVIDVATQAHRGLLEGPHANRYRVIEFQADWSPDGSEVCFAGAVADEPRYELVVVSSNGSSQGFDVILNSPQQIHSAAWSRDGKTILYSHKAPKYAGVRLFTIARDQPRQATVLKGQPMGQDNSGGQWSPDGKQIFFSSRVVTPYLGEASD